MPPQQLVRAMRGRRRCCVDVLSPCLRCAHKLAMSSSPLSPTRHPSQPPRWRWRHASLDCFSLWSHGCSRTAYHVRSYSAASGPYAWLCKPHAFYRPARFQPAARCSHRILVAAPHPTVRCRALALLGKLPEGNASVNSGRRRWKRRRRFKDNEDDERCAAQSVFSRPFSRPSTQPPQAMVLRPPPRASVAGALELHSRYEPPLSVRSRRIGHDLLKQHELGRPTPFYSRGAAAQRLRHHHNILIASGHERGGTGGGRHRGVEASSVSALCGVRRHRRSTTSLPTPVRRLLIPVPCGGCRRLFASGGTV